MENDQYTGCDYTDNQKGRSLWHLGALLTFKALGEETNNQFWALEGLADSHMAVPLHAHTREDEIWYVLEGKIKFYIGDQTRIGTAGSFVYIPRNVAAHIFRLVSIQPGGMVLARRRDLTSGSLKTGETGAVFDSAATAFWST